MNRGSTMRGRPKNRPLSGFNEAPIHESGKWQGQGHRAKATARFNEAPIHESGKSLGTAPTQVQPRRLQ